MMRNKKAAYLFTVIVLLMTAGCGHYDTDSDVSTVDTININDEIDTAAEEKLAAYRRAREEKKPIDLGNGVVMGGSVNEAENKGVANGYEPENIYMREYCDNGTWQYLILVRDGKDSAWKVIHHGSLYVAEG